MTGMKFFAGMIVDESGKPAAQSVVATGAESLRAIEAALAQALNQARIQRDRLAYIISTGYGRERVEFGDGRITEITAHGRGALSLFPGTRTVIDIGGQDSKVIRLDEAGRVINFQMNDKCAAGTGRFLEVMARALEVDVAQMGELSLNSRNPLRVSSVCTVFAESEVVGLIARGEKREDILRAIHAAVADRTQGLAGRVGLKPEVTLSGGVAKNKGVVRALEERLGFKVNIPQEPQTTGALGAALIARDREMKGK
jgi:predicted CoA-substrate-specific enzyme activase